MLEAENLESLSNADLRAKCIKYGLPNVPITDSSRSILIKKLRATMTGSGAQKKSSNRRETIHVVKTAETIEKSKEDVVVGGGNRTPSRGSNRRTIAGTPTREREREPVGVEKPLITENAAPISARRRSVNKQEKVQTTKSAVEARPTIIIESDEDDDEDLILAAEQAEQLRNNPPPRSSRSVSLSKTGVLTTSYNQVKSPLLQEKIIEETTAVDSGKIPNYRNAGGHEKYSNAPNILQGNTRSYIGEPLFEQKSYVQPSLSSRYTLDSLSTSSGRYSTGVVGAADNYKYYSPRYSSATASAPGVSLRSKPISTTTLYNEQSDDTEGNADEAFETPYLSSFARNLERIKAEPLGSSETDFAAKRLKRHKAMGISGRRPVNDSIAESMRQFWIAVDKKYHIRFYLTLFGVFCLIVFIYVLLFL